MNNQVTDLEPAVKAEPKTTSQTLLMNCPKTFGSSDLSEIVKAMTHAFSTYSFSGAMISDGKLSLTITRIDDKKFTRSSIFQIRRAWTLCVRGWRIRDLRGQK